jgi:hypothetical protein
MIHGAKMAQLTQTFDFAAMFSPKCMNV